MGIECKICGNENRFIFSAIILNKYAIKFFFCDFCRFLETEKPFWLDESYEESINRCDTGIIQRNLHYSIISSNIIFNFFDRNMDFLDYAGGYGIFTRLMRDIGYNFFWYDPFTKNIVAKGFEFVQDTKIELITSFEAFEHFLDPLKSIESMINISPNILFSTVLLPSPIPEPPNWWYYGLNHGQHISFYSLETLKFLSNKLNLNLYTNNRDLHLLTEKKMNTHTFKKLTNYSIAKVFYLYHKCFLESKTWNDSLKSQSQF